MSNERQRGIQVHRPIIYGSHARLLTEEERASAPENHTHRWTVFLTSATSPAPTRQATSSDPFPEGINYLPGGLDDLSYLVKRVTFKLHETYSNPARICDKPPFVVSETGWGEFTVNINIRFVQESGEKPLNLQHGLKLHHWGPPIAAPPPVSATGPPLVAETSVSAVRSTALPAADGLENAGGDGDGDVKMEAVTPAIPVEPESATTHFTSAPNTESQIESLSGPSAKAQDTGGLEPEPSGSTEPTEPTEPTNPDSQTQTQTQTQTQSQTQRPPTSAEPDPQPRPKAQSSPPGEMIESHPVQPIPTQTHTSIASKYPVHAWQYDEIVFSDPFQSFLSILNAHPPTPLPARNRRARDQREGDEIRLGKKKLRVEGDTGQDLDGGREVVKLGVVGENGSADVPLEFTGEMEKGEWNSLNDARIRIVGEMDKWREKLIALEKESMRIREEMGLA